MKLSAYMMFLKLMRNVKFQMMYNFCTYQHIHLVILSLVWSGIICFL